MDDLVTMLRSLCADDPDGFAKQYCGRAADEIERLRSALQQMVLAADKIRLTATIDEENDALLELYEIADGEPRL